MLTPCAELWTIAGQSEGALSICDRILLILSEIRAPEPSLELIRFPFRIAKKDRRLKAMSEIKSIRSTESMPWKSLRTDRSSRLYNVLPTLPTRYGGLVLFSRPNLRSPIWVDPTRSPLISRAVLICWLRIYKKNKTHARRYLEFNYPNSIYYSTG